MLKIGTFHVQPVSGDNRAAEAGLFNACEQAELVIQRFALGQAVRHKDNAGLGQSLDDQHAGHDGRTRKMPLKERLVEGEVLVRLDARHALDFHHAIHQKERVTVGEKFENTPDFETGDGGVAHGSSLKNNV